jgi:hypothetical protein
MSERRHEIRLKILELQQSHPDGLSVNRCARELGISVSYAYDCYNDPDGIIKKKLIEQYAGICEICGAKTSGSNGKKLAPKRCKKHHTGGPPKKWTNELIIEAIQEWHLEHGDIPGANDWAKTDRPDWCPATNTVYRNFGSWNNAIVAAGFTPRPREPPDYVKSKPGEGVWELMNEEQRERSRQASRERMLKALEDPNSAISKGQKLGQELGRKMFARMRARREFKDRDKFK